MSPGFAATVIVIAILCAISWSLGAVLGKRGEPLRDWLSMHLRHRGRDATGARPIEAIAADLRRLGARFHALPAHASYSKVEALRTAYDRTLAECCAALGITHLLTVLPPGVEQDAERERVEEQLADAGVRGPA